MDLRPYQQQCIDGIWRELSAGSESALAVVPTGGGKSLILAELCRQVAELGKRALVLTHVRELIEQLDGTLGKHCPSVERGVYAAGLGRREMAQVTLAQIHSAYTKGFDLGAPSCVIVDEVHLIPDSGDGMYRRIMGDLRLANPKMKLIGLTATPYRLSSGLICGEDQLFKAICYEADLAKLISDGYLSPLVTKNAGSPDLTGVHTRLGDYVESELAAVMEDEEKVRLAVKEIVERGKDRRAWLLFACSVKHAQMIAAEVAKYDIKCPVVTGDMPSDERTKIVQDYKAGRIDCLVNVNVLTTGFDAPHIDLIASLRPTQSPGLWYQTCGRGLRKAEGKDDCLVLDFGGNAERHGPLNLLTERVRNKRKGNGTGEAPSKTCPECSEVVATSLRACPVCGHEFPAPETARHDPVASEAPIIAERPETWEEVTKIKCRPWTKKGATTADPRTMRVDYCNGHHVIASEWICVEHPMGTFARTKAQKWMRDAGLIATATDNVETLCAKLTWNPVAIKTKQSDTGFLEVTGIQWQHAKAPQPLAATVQPIDDSLPF